MGVIKHNAIIATINDIDDELAIKKFIENLNKDEQKLFHIFPPVVNYYVTVVMAPDGSKEGWEDSNNGDELREKFIDLLETLYFVDYVEVEYGEYGQKIIRGNCENYK